MSKNSRSLLQTLKKQELIVNDWQDWPLQQKTKKKKTHTHKTTHKSVLQTWKLFSIIMQ